MGFLTKAYVLDIFTQKTMNVTFYMFGRSEGKTHLKTVGTSTVFVYKLFSYKQNFVPIAIKRTTPLLNSFVGSYPSFRKGISWIFPQYLPIDAQKGIDQKDA